MSAFQMGSIKVVNVGHSTKVLRLALAPLFLVVSPAEAQPTIGGEFQCYDSDIVCKQQEAIFCEGNPNSCSVQGPVSGDEMPEGEGTVLSPNQDHYGEDEISEQPLDGGNTEGGPVNGDSASGPPNGGSGHEDPPICQPVSVFPPSPPQIAFDPDENALAVAGAQRYGSIVAAYLWLSAVSGVPNPYPDSMQLGGWTPNAFGLQYGDSGNFNYGETGVIVFTPIVKQFLLFDAFVEPFVELILLEGSAAYQVLKGDTSELTWWGEDPKDLPFIRAGMDRGRQVLRAIKSSQPIPPSTSSCP